MPDVTPPTRTVFLGSGGFGVESLRRLAASSAVAVAGVVTAPPRAAGRGGRLTPTPIHAVATELGIDPVLTPSRLRDPAAIDAVLALDPHLLVLADHGNLVPAALLDLPHGALNLHPSLLPRHRGATPIPAAILAGDTETGVTLMRMDEGLDTGAIVAQARVALDDGATTPTLEARLAVLAADLLEAHLGSWIAGSISPSAQTYDGATFTRPLRREDGRLDPTKTAIDLERQVRAFQPWPGSFVDTPFGRLVVWAAHPEEDGAGDAPERGRFDARGLGVGAGERLAIDEVQPAGGSRMAWDAYLHGRPSIVGASISE
jgi:methionyl-tRNA formyltransferase